MGRLATTTTAGGRSKRPHKVKIKVVVTAAGLTPTGNVTVLRGRKVVKSGVALVGGRATIVLHGQPSGRGRYAVAYDGATQTLSSRSSRIRITVL